MNQKLQRIEAALNQIQDYPRSPSVAEVSKQSAPPTDDVDRTVNLPPLLPQASANIKPTPDVSSPNSKGSSSSLESLLKLPADASIDASIKVLSLPRVNAPGFTSHHNAANPALSLNLLKELEGIVTNWQTELAQVLRQIQAIYLEGPILDGWLESYTCHEGSAPEFRHAEVDCLMTYVEKLTKTPAEAEETSPTEALSAGYRLCGMNEEGQIWFRHCPAEQVPAVSIAILRYQRLKTLLGRKDALQNRLSRLSESLIDLHSEARLMQDEK